MANEPIKKIAVLTSGGDAPGMNAAIRAIVRAGIYNGLEVYGIEDGYRGLVEGRIKLMTRNSVSEIINRGGTILGTARLPEFADDEVAKKGVENLKALGIDCLVAIGGDGTYRGVLKLHNFGINCIGIPGTIDNDIASTEFTIGFDTAVNTAVDAIDKLRDTCNSHHRCSVIEVMGRYCGDLAYAAGIASGADIIITSETGYDEERIINFIHGTKAEKHHRLLIVITEKVTDVAALAKRIRIETGWDSRATILGHIQRGGNPTPFDRVLATRLGDAAVDALIDGKSGVCMGVFNNEIIATPITEAFGMTKNVFRKYAIPTNRSVR
jgi:6-phosphofructokinase 1